MKEAMMNAQVGDDVFGEDPTVNELEAKVANMFGKDAAIFCPSGTMTNQIALKVHTQPMDEVLCDVRSHIYQYEAGGYAFNSGISIKLIHSEKGILTASDVLANINPEDVHKPVTKLVSLENTVNKGGGNYYTRNEMEAVWQACEKTGLKLHLDGARLFNALVETGDRPRDVGALFDSISICLSKGLGAPVGSLLIGSQAFIKQARRVRKVFGGGMRQAGMLAAAGIYALDNHVFRLKEDHGRAGRLGEALKNRPFVKNLLPVYTNIVVFELTDKWTVDGFLQKLKDQGIMGVPFGGNSVRMVTHLDIGDDDVEEVIEKLAEVRG
jgi:threonine aldolase